MTAQERLRESLTIGRKLGNRVEIARSLDTCALLAHQRELTIKAVRLLGAAASLRESLGRLRSADATTRAEQILSAARAHLGEHVVTDLLAQGHAMTTADAVDYAIAAWDDAGEKPAELPNSAR